MSDAPRYRIQAVAEMTGVPTGTLRAWERRYGVPKPDRSQNSYRLYTEADLAAIRAVARMCGEGMAPSEAARVVLARLERGDPPDGLEDAAPIPSPAFEDDVWASASRSIVEAASSFDATQLDFAVRRATMMGPAYEVFDRAFRPALAAMGDRWADGVTGVGEEHLASAAISTAMRGLVALSQPIKPRRRLLLACVATETHQLPLDGVALYAAARGWRTTQLGARTPPDALAAAVRGLGPDAVGLSVTVALQGEDAGALFDRYRRACEGRPWIVGGAQAVRYAGEVEAAGGVVATATEDLAPFLAAAESR